MARFVNIDGFWINPEHVVCVTTAAEGCGKARTAITTVENCAAFFVETPIEDVVAKLTDPDTDGGFYTGCDEIERRLHGVHR